MNKTSVLILGSNGFIGRELVSFFEKNNKYDLISLNRKQLDLMDKMVWCKIGASCCFKSDDIGLKSVDYASIKISSGSC